MVGEVVEVGKNVEGVKIGDRLFPVPAYAKNDMMRAATVGGFSEYVELPEFKLNHSAWIVDDKIESKIASIIEPFTVGANAVLKIGNIEAGKNAIVFGAGAIGLTAAMTFKYLGCKTIVVDLMDSRLEVAKSLGMETVNPAKENYVEKCCELLGETYSFTGKAIDCDYYVDAAGNQAIIDSYFSAAKPFSTLSIVAVHHKPVTMNLIPLTYGGLRIVGPMGGDGSDIKLVMEILASHQFPVENIITHTFSHDNIIEAFEQASKAEEALKVVIDYSME